MAHPVLIKKYSGEEEAFDPARLRKALNRAHTSGPKTEQIVSAVTQGLYPGISTREIYTTAFNLLRESRPSTAARYNLKRAIMELGPTGFPFENYVAELLKAEGYETKVGVIVQGKCVQHEVDVVASIDKEYRVMECKFHSQQGKVCDVKVPLYVHSRFRDILAMKDDSSAPLQQEHQGWVVTNTRLTKDAIQYGTCAGLKLWAWDYPKGKGLKEVIDRIGLYPLSCLTSLSAHEKEMLLNQRVVLCKELIAHPDLLSNLGISTERQDKVLSEARELCQ